MGLVIMAPWQADILGQSLFKPQHFRHSKESITKKILRGIVGEGVLV